MPTVDLLSIAQTRISPNARTMVSPAVSPLWVGRALLPFGEGIDYLTDETLLALGTDSVAPSLPFDGWVLTDLRLLIVRAGKPSLETLFLEDLAAVEERSVLGLGVVDLWDREGRVFSILARTGERLVPFLEELLLLNELPREPPAPVRQGLISADRRPHVLRTFLKQQSHLTKTERRALRARIRLYDRSLSMGLAGYEGSYLSPLCPDDLAKALHLAVGPGAEVWQGRSDVVTLRWAWGRTKQELSLSNSLGFASKLLFGFGWKTEARRKTIEARVFADPIERFSRFTLEVFDGPGGNDVSTDGLLQVQEALHDITGRVLLARVLQGERLDFDALSDATLPDWARNSNAVGIP